MHSNILTDKQMDLVPIVQEYGKSGYYLVGGTALALQLGHRRSIDFDLFTLKHFNNDNLIEKVEKNIRLSRRMFRKLISSLS